MNQSHSDLPKVWISYDHGPKEGDMTVVEEGQYVPDGVLSFDLDECNGVRFEMDGIQFEIVGDLGGHAIYRRLDDSSSVYAMPWTVFSKSTSDEVIEITQTN